MPHRSTPDVQDGPHPDAPRHELDVRPLLAAGHEPFTEIMAALADLEPGGVLALRAPFDPRPLHAVMRRRGHRHVVRKQGPHDVEVLYWRDAEAPGAPSPALGSAEPSTVAEIIDVRGLTPPEPMEPTLAALEHLPRGQALVQINERIPVFLLPVLEERGFAYAIADDPRGYRTAIWRRPTKGALREGAYLHVGAGGNA
jgi:uncharacterized protein (DUF2249 family)